MENHKFKGPSSSRKINKISLSLLIASALLTPLSATYAAVATNPAGTVTNTVTGVAIGTNSSSEGTSISIGQLATTLAPEGAVAIGNNATAVTDGSIAIGEKSIAGRPDMDNPQDPNNRTTVGKRNNIAIGYGAMAEGGRVISIGENAGTGTIDNWNIQNVNIGTNSGSNSKRDYAVAIGFEAGYIQSDAAKAAQASVDDSKRGPSVYIGKQAGKNTAAYEIIGIGKEAAKDLTDTRLANSIMIGNGSGLGMTSNDGRNATFGGFGSGANILVGSASGRNLSGDGNVAVGNIAGDGSKGDNNVYVGHLAGQNSSNDRSIIMGPQSGLGSINDRAVLIGNFANGGVTTPTRNAIGIGSLVQSTAYESTAIGFLARALANNTNAIGRLALANAVNATAIGTNAVASGTSAIAIGTGAQASNTNAISIGTGNIVSGENSGAIGDPSVIRAANSYSLGNNNTIDALVVGGVAVDNTSTTGAHVLGNNVVAKVDNSVYLGNYSYATTGTAIGTVALTSTGTAGATTTAGDTGMVNSATVNGVTYSGFAGAKANGVVTVGASGSERRIQNLAAGEISATSTDAINGSQLYQIVDKLNTDVVAAKTEVVSTNNSVTITPITNNTDGHVTYDLAVATTSLTNNTDGTVVAGDTTSYATADSVANAINNAVNTINGSLPTDISYTANGGTKSSVSLKNGFNFTDGTNTTASVGPDGKVTYNLNDDIALNSVTANTIKGNSLNIGDTVTINNGGINMGDTKITGLAAGDVSSSSTDAVNGAQLYQSSLSIANAIGGNSTVNPDGSVNANLVVNGNTYNTVQDAFNGQAYQINSLGDEIKTVGAQSAALGALKTIQYDPLEPTQIMAGVGYYRGAGAIALGLAHYKNESLMFHVGAAMATTGDHDLMANAGVTWKVGARADETAIKDTYRQGPISSTYALQDRLQALEEQNRMQQEYIKALEEKFDALLASKTK